jgi:hypothetical protein
MCASALVAAAVTPIAVHASGATNQSTGQGSAQGQSTRPASDPALNINVNVPFTRSFADNCQYTGALRGQVEKLGPVGLLRTESYRPDLTLNGQVRCPDGFSQPLPTQHIRVASMTGAELEHQLETVARVQLKRNGRLCTVNPDFMWRGDQLAVGDNITQACERMRGGGPR